MKIIVLGIFVLSTIGLNAQIETPRLSPNAEIEQTIGLTEVDIDYSRPSKNERTIFGDIVPFNEVWRTGANENTTIELSDAIIFGQDTLQAGEYSIYSLPNKESWIIYFYKTIDNWGNPKEWKEDLIVLAIQARVIKLNDVVESFTISIDNLTTKSAELAFSWDKTKAVVSFTVPTDKLIDYAIEKTMAGPSANDYYNAADYFLTEKKDLPKALEWITKAIEIRGEQAFWMTYKKALIQAEMKDYKGAILTANISMDAAEKAGHKKYVERNKKVIEKWSKL